MLEPRILSQSFRLILSEPHNSIKYWIKSKNIFRASKHTQALLRVFGPLVCLLRRGLILGNTGAVVGNSVGDADGIIVGDTVGFSIGAVIRWAVSIFIPNASVTSTASSFGTPACAKTGLVGASDARSLVLG